MSSVNALTYVNYQAWTRHSVTYFEEKKRNLLKWDRIA
jgi:hypothetical protein